MPAFGLRAPLVSTPAVSATAHAAKVVGAGLGADEVGSEAEHGYTHPLAVCPLVKTSAEPATQESGTATTTAARGLAEVVIKKNEGLGRPTDETTGAPRTAAIFKLLTAYAVTT